MGARAGRSPPEIFLQEVESYRSTYASPRTISVSTLVAGASVPPPCTGIVEIPSTKDELLGRFSGRLGQGSDPAPSTTCHPRPTTSSARRPCRITRRSSTRRAITITALNPRRLNRPTSATATSFSKRLEHRRVCDGGRRAMEELRNQRGRSPTAPKDRPFLSLRVSQNINCFREELYSMVPRGADDPCEHSLWLDYRYRSPISPTRRGRGTTSAAMEAIVEGAGDPGSQQRDSPSDRYRTALTQTPEAVSSTPIPAGTRSREMRFDTGLYCRGFPSVSKHRWTHTGTDQTRSRQWRPFAARPNLARIGDWPEPLRGDIQSGLVRSSFGPVNVSRQLLIATRRWQQPQLNSRGLILGCRGLRKGRSVVDRRPRSGRRPTSTPRQLYWPGWRRSNRSFWLRCCTLRSLGGGV